MWWIERLKVVYPYFACSGYISLEYVRHGHFSVKVDVCSFGILVLELISEDKITSFYESVM